MVGWWGGGVVGWWGGVGRWDAAVALGAMGLECDEVGLGTGSRHRHHHGLDQYFSGHLLHSR